MPIVQDESGRRGIADSERMTRLGRERHSGDVVAIVGCIVALSAVLGGAALAAWSLATDDERIANTTPQNVSLAY